MAKRATYLTDTTLPSWVHSLGVAMQRYVATLALLATYALCYDYSSVFYKTFSF